MEPREVELHPNEIAAFLRVYVLKVARGYTIIAGEDSSYQISRSQTSKQKV